MLKLLVVLPLTLSLLLVACGGDDDSDDGGNGPDAATPTQGSSRDEDDDEPGGGEGSDFHACSLFTAEEISEVVEEEMGEGRDYLATAAKATGCTWESVDGLSAVFIEVLLENGQGWYEAVHIDGEVEELDGLGDVAVWDPFLGTVDVVDDDRYIAVQPVLILSEVDKKAAAIELADMAVERLP